MVNIIMILQKKTLSQDNTGEVEKKKIKVAAVVLYPY